ncbi:NAD(P)-dependent oxidoreductase (plasmid) [Sinorhizobium meliloti]|uniref:SDR family NAD(P)-dependent oxidoreductase n=1 Tax=Rhizobium meliloti TaxID=382 RepID=UPI000B49E783|nr:SDR family oxidoreductase [Sinorhizobium meliloti]ASP74394.1 NAD(P)-dependent oxidoreductase [Sinorhizobium meliloti]MDE3857484.1 SDR family oxidoreductase [Sinorhizobium meliloti]MQW49632.1 glucose 1-dehydrogenase [Sinorhizobium meliloti]MQW49683.1 glucose 1-dehydrogenase [Sinorhizobium meliloti]RVI62033.1 SDR family oxidoreductase [Sinorhizobium meliloti]
MKRFEGRAVIVTGAGSGIGAACVRRLHAEGADVVAVDVTQESVDKIVSEFGGSDRILGAVLDVRDQAAAQNLATDTRARLGRLNGLINCAGITGVASILDVEPEKLERVMAVNLGGTVNMCQAFVRAVRDDTGSRAIVNISSGAGVMGVPNRLPYVASKFAVSGITKSMSPELGPLGIRVNAVAPGMTKTPLVEYMLQDPAAVARINAAHPIGRMGEPEEIAAVIVFLLTDDASFMTGAVVSVDGGQTACL